MITSFFEKILKAREKKVSNQFLITGNVNDYILHDGEFLSMKEYLGKNVSPDKNVIFYDMAEGMTFRSESEGDRIGREFGHENAWKVAIEESGVYSVVTLKRLRTFLSACARSGFPVVLFILNAEMLFPVSNGPLSDTDRQRVLQLEGILGDPEFCRSECIVGIVSNFESSINPRLIGRHSLCKVQVERPDANDRLAILQKMRPGMTDVNKITDATAGMTSAAIRNICLENSEITIQAVIDRLSELLQAELGDKISIVSPSHTMADVVGNTELKKVLDRIGKYIAHDDPRISPTGMLVSGPNGVGKTFIFEAWAGQLGMTVLSLKNIRSMYFGQTDILFETLKSVLQQMSNVMIVVDEADVVFSKPGKDTHETEARLFGNVIKMMGDTKNRGRIIWLMMTARPERLAPDLIRPGRCGLHIPVFDPEGEDRTSYIKTFFSGMLDEAAIAHMSAITSELSPSDFNELRVLMKGEKAISPGCSAVDLLEVAKSYRPADIATERRHQIESAKRFCSFSSLLPKVNGMLDIEKTITVPQESQDGSTDNPGGTAQLIPPPPTPSQLPNGYLARTKGKAS